MPTNYPSHTTLLLLSRPDTRDRPNEWRRILLTAVMVSYTASRLTHSAVLSDGAVGYALLCGHYSALLISVAFWRDAGGLPGAEFQSTERTHSCASALPSRQSEHEVDLESHPGEDNEAGVQE